jgi:bacteriocin biosynthesis cyclodehydratase domain-containing protein
MTRHPGFPARPLLRPGVRVCRRADGVLQIGLDRSLAVVAADSAEVHEVLDGLRSGVPPASPPELSASVARLCADLLDRSLVVDGDLWLDAIGSADTDLARAGLSAAIAESGLEARRVLDRRRSVGVAVEGSGLSGAADRARDLLASSGTGTGRDVVLLISSADPDRSLVDDWVRADLPHVFLTATEGVLRVGPFVVPGRTACLRCIDAHHTEHDPRRALVLQQYAEATQPRDGLPEPVPADLLDIAVGYVVRDLVNWIDGHRPATWSATVRIDGRLELARTPWPRHPGCGCSWSQALAM